MGDRHPFLEPLRVVLVRSPRCDWSRIRDHLEACSDMRVVAEASNPGRASKVVGERLPDVLLISVHQPVREGLAAVELLKTAHPYVGILVLSTESWQRDGALAAGADGFLPRDAPAEVVIGAIRAIGQRSRGRVRWRERAVTQFPFETHGTLRGGKNDV